MAPAEAPAETARATAEQTTPRTQREPPANRGGTQSDPARLVWVLPIQPAQCHAAGGRMGAGKNAPRPPPTAQTPRHGQGSGTHGIPGCLVCSARTVQPEGRPSAIASIPDGTPLTGGPDAGNPPVRFGGRGEVQILIPTLFCRKPIPKEMFYSR